MQIIALADKKWMFLDVQHDVEITGGTAEGSGFAASVEADARAVFHSGRNFRIDRALAENAAVAFALRAGVSDHAAASLAGGTSSRDAEEALLIAYLAAACARAAGGRSLAGRGA